MRSRGDTIAAIATAQGEGGIAIVRVSGPGALPALEAVFARKSAENAGAGGSADSAGARTAGLEAVFERKSGENAGAGGSADSAGARTAGLEAVFARKSAENAGAGGSAGSAGARTAGLEAVFARKSAGDAGAPARAWQPNRLYYGHVVEDGRAVDEAMAVFMAAPRSYTREDVCEIHVHGGRYAAEKALMLVLGQGARAAEPGEFTLRAFLNGRIDLSQAEAVMAMIASSGESAARAAARQMDGSLGRFVAEASDRLVGMLSQIEAGVDFPEEVDERATERQLRGDIDQLIRHLSAAVDERAARILREGLTVAIAGAPNAGKSSLMNAILMSDRAIVTPVPGTTRDVLSERLRLGGLDILLLDTAGLRESDDEAERQGVERAKKAVETADVVLLVLDGSIPAGEAERALLQSADERTIVALNKLDLGIAEARAGYRVSAKTRAGLDALMAELKRRAGAGENTESRLTHPRHIDCVKRAIASLSGARGALDAELPLDLLAVDLMAALSALGEITGQDASEEVIRAVFKNFCVGK